MKDVTFIAAFPKSGITYLNFMLFHLLFDCPQNAQRIDSDYIFDVHEALARVPPPGTDPRYIKVHFAYSPAMPLHDRAIRAVCLVRDPIDVMMSVWDFRHLTGEDGLLRIAPEEEAAKLAQFTQHWITTGGAMFPWAGSWVANVSSWLDQSHLPILVVSYENLKRKPVEQLERILHFLDRQASSERIAAAVEVGKVDNMRKIESAEVAKRASGIFFRPSLSEGYAKGYRFIGRLHEGSSKKVLSPAAQQHASRIFGSVMARVRLLSG
jgi:Sulfotransferase domain